MAIGILSLLEVPRKDDISDLRDCRVGGDDTDHILEVKLSWIVTLREY